MNALVIGGNGFVGSHLVDLLLLKGHNVRVFDASNEYYRKPLSKVDYRIFTLDDTLNLTNALSDIEIVFYAASTSGHDMIFDINKLLIPTINLLDLMKKFGIKRFVFFSSGSAVYGNSNTILVNEEQVLDPISSYGVIKATIEKYVMLYQSKCDIKPLIIRSANKYGPRQGNSISKGIISTFLRKVKLNESLIVFGDGNSFKDYIYITDLINIAYELSFTDKCGIYNVGSGCSESINQILRQIKIVTNCNLEINYENKKMQDVDSFTLDISKITNLFENYPFISLYEGVSKIWNWLN